MLRQHLAPLVQSLLRRAATLAALKGVVEDSRCTERRCCCFYRSFGEHLAPLVQSLLSLFEELSAFVGPQYPRELRYSSISP